MIKPSLYTRLESLVTRHQELGILLSAVGAADNTNQFRDLSKEYAQLEPVVNCFQRYEQSRETLESTQALLLTDHPDSEMLDLIKDEVKNLQVQLQDLETELESLLLPRDTDDDCNVFLEIRAGTGGDEAALFAGDLFRMYSRYAEIQRWQLEVVNVAHGEHGGYKELILRIAGQGVYSHLKFESGAHRVQRVPITESQGRIHTSACTVAVLVEPRAIDEVIINPADLRTDTYRASGAGGQHINKTDSAVRITHLPTGIVVECQDERSQHKNRARAMSLLQAKILAGQKQEQEQKQAAMRRNLVGSGDRSERIRTYNFPQGRLTDHRINLTLYKLEEILEGALSQVIEPLAREHRADQLAAHE